MALHTRSSLVALVLAAGSVSSVAHAQSWASATDGSWFNALNWTPQTVPTGAGAVATLGLAGAYTATTTSNTIGGVHITNPAATMAIAANNGVILSSGGTYTLNGRILVNDSGSYAGTNLIIGTLPVAFSGTGKIQLNASPSDGGTTANTATIGTQGGTLTMGSGTTVAGFGRLNGVSTTNNGTFTADVSGRPLLVTAGTHQNNGLYTAANTGGLVLDGCTVTQSGSGSMAPGAGSSVQLSNTSVTGGSLVSTVDGRVQVNPGTGATLNGVSISGGLDQYHSSTVVVGPSGLTFVGGSALVVNVNGNYAGTHIRFPSVGTPLNGNGTLRLNASTSDGSTTAATAEMAQDGGSPGGTVAVGSGVQVAGFGIINNLGTTNNGAINADVDSRYLRVEGGTHQNNSLYEATGGGALLLNSTTVNQAPGGVIVAIGSGPSTNNSSVQLSNATVNGGTLVSTGNARVQLNGGSSGFLSGVAVTNGLDTYQSSALHIDNPGLTLNGGATVLVNASGAYAGTSMRAGDPNTMIGGNGTVRLNASTSDGATTSQTSALLGDDANASFVFGPNVTLAGFGQVALPTTNNGTFRADIAGRPLRVQGTQQNNHFYQSTNGGVVWLVGATVTQAGGASIMAGQDSAVTLSSSTVTGGTIGSAAGSNGAVNIDASSCGLENLSVSRQLSVDPSGTLHSASTLTLTNNAVLTVNTTGAYAGTNFRADGVPTLLTGTGRVHLNASTSDGATTANTALMYRNTDVAGSGFSFGPGITVDGFGRILGGTVNNGTVSANTPGRPLRVEGEQHQNNSRYESRDGGSLQLVATTVNQSATGVINAGDGSDLTLFGATVLGGTFSRDGSGAGYVGSSSTLGGNLTLNAPMNVNPTTGLTITSGGITNNSVITVNTNAAYAGTSISADGPATAINGTGEVRLNRSSSDGATTANTALVSAGAGADFAFGPGQSLTGNGRIGAPVTMNGAVSPGVGAGGVGFFRNDGTLTMTSSGRLIIDITGPGTFDSIQNAGTFTAGGAAWITAAPGYSPTAGTTFDILTGGTTGGHFNQVFSFGLASTNRFGVRVDPGRVRVTVLCGLADIGGAGADANGDGSLDNNDFIVFIDRFFAQDPLVDFGRAGGQQGSDGLFDNNDFIAFIDLFFAGCF